MSNLTEHLRSRYMDVDNTRVWLNEPEQCAVFPLFNLSGQFYGYHSYRRYGAKTTTNDPYLDKYFTRVTSGYPIYWGLDSWNYSNTLFLVEGLFDAARLHSAGLSALAVFSNHPKALVSWLHTLQRPVVAVCDGDAAGVKLMGVCCNSVVLPHNEDVSSLNHTEFGELLQCLHDW